MRTRYGVSPWVDQFPRSRQPAFPRARGTFAVDVAIVGGGLSGCATAHACATAGLKAVLLEADRIGQGSSGRSAGLLLPEPGPAFRDVAKRHGVRAARQVFESWRRASLDAAALLRRLGIKCGLQSQAALIVAWREDERLLRREHDARDGAGLDVAWLGRPPLQKFALLDATAAMKMDATFALDPYRACVGLARAAATRGARLFEHSKMRRVAFDRKAAQLTTAEASIRARTVVVTTGTASPEYQQLRRHFNRREAYLVVTEPMEPAMRKAVGPRLATLGDTRRPHHRIRWIADDRILVAGADQAETASRMRHAVRVQRTGQLMYELSTMYPAISGLRPEYGWELPYGETADGLMYVGAHRNFPHHLFALGRGGDSVTGAFLAARILVRAIQGAPEKSDEVFSWVR